MPLLLKTLLLLSDNKFNPKLKNMIKSWDENSFSALQIFELVDTAKTYELADINIIEYLEYILYKKLKEENKTMKSLIDEVKWYKLSNDIFKLVV